VISRSDYGPVVQGFKSGLTAAHFRATETSGAIAPRDDDSMQRQNMTTTWYKVLGPNGDACHGGSGQWFLPKGKRPGKWMPTLENVQCWRRGYHLVPLHGVMDWLTTDAQQIWEAEGRGPSHSDDGNKTAFASARLVRRLQWDTTAARLYGADCAARVLHVYESQSPQDERPREAIVATRAYARGEINAAAWAAARAAAGAAARAAAWDAAGAAAWAAARAAAWDAARDAARDAAGAAAWDAARAAAWDAARAAAGAAAWDAAWDAERQWQVERLRGYLYGEIAEAWPLPDKVGA
jgi:hypothetical protein